MMARVNYRPTGKGLEKTGSLRCRFRLALVIFFWITPVAAQQTVNLVGDPWPPYVKGNLGGYAEEGIAVDIVSRVFAQIDRAEVRFPLIPWKRALLEVEKGDSDGIVILLKTPERESYMQFTAALVTGHNLIWSVAGDNGEAFDWNSISDLYDKRIGVVQGYSYGDEMDAGIAAGRIETVEVPTVEQLFSMLEAGRIELIMSNDAVGYELARVHDKVKIKASARPVNAETFYIGLSRKSSAVELIPEINRAIEKLRSKGVIERIVRGGTVE